MIIFDHIDYLETAHHIVDNFDTDVTHEQVDAWDDYDLREWVLSWRDVDDEEEEDGVQP